MKFEFTEAAKYIKSNNTNEFNYPRYAVTTANTQKVFYRESI
jgi:hypothetical protein